MITLVGRSGLPYIKLHGTRHTAATVMLATGVPIKDVSTRLGHSTISMTADTYARSLADQQRSAADTMGAAIFGERREAS